MVDTSEGDGNRGKGFEKLKMRRACMCVFEWWRVCLRVVVALKQFTWCGVVARVLACGCGIEAVHVVWCGGACWRGVFCLTVCGCGGMVTCMCASVCKCVCVCVLRCAVVL